MYILNMMHIRTEVREMLEETNYIYALCDCDDGTFLYVGQSRKPSQRYTSHFQDAKTHHINKRWLLELIKAKKNPLLFILERCPNSQANIRENYWIKKITDNGYKLNNVAPLAVNPTLKPIPLFLGENTPLTPLSVVCEQQGLNIDAMKWAIGHHDIPTYIDNETLEIHFINHYLTMTIFLNTVLMAQNRFKNPSVGWFMDY